ncbi:MAG: PLP-dependent transferase [Actinomycetia bacterium]|nr:PLP-dependent transferase [Actinomycetes bacterium]
MANEQPELDPRSWVVTAGRSDRAGDPLNVPLVPASNYIYGGDFGYARDEGTPTWHALETLIGGLEGGRTLSFSSGMGAVAAVFDLLPVGATVVIPDDCYQGVVGVAEDGATRGRWTVERVALTDTKVWVEALQRADLVWLESPSNPLLNLADVATIGAAPRRAGTLLVVDNTFATPLNQQPLALGADISMMSVTKYIGGHSDLLAGSLTTNDKDLFDALHRSRLLTGATPGSLEAYLAVRGARTLAIRLEAAQANAQAIAEYLAGHRSVVSVLYPGLPDHPQHGLAKAHLGGFGTIITFDIGSAEAATALCEATTLIRHATSLGAVESTMERRAAIIGQEHLPAGLIRLSVGIEAVDDLLADLRRALPR